MGTDEQGDMTDAPLAPFRLVDSLAGHAHLMIEVNPMVSLEALEGMTRVAVAGYLCRVGDEGGSRALAVGQVKGWVDEAFARLQRN